MNYSVRLSHTAATDMHAAVDYIKLHLHNPDAARSLVDKISQTIESLEQFPTRHAVASDPILKAWSFRYVTINHYLLFYQIDDEHLTVYIVRFLHEQQNWQLLLNKRANNA